MSGTFLTVIIAVVVVAIMALGLSITRIRKGRDIQSDVGGNDEMKKRGLGCASHQFRTEDAALIKNNRDKINVSGCHCAENNSDSCSN
ncbi:MAG: hypothetical protein IMY73_01465 [Bacteroidetes bacterium]|nr:hypothetical protein [Bacteroidota bacterium]